MKKERQSNFELMRIVSIFFIILWHILIHGKVLNDIGEPYAFIKTLLQAILIIHVNSLIFITGYFNGDKKEVKTKKAFQLLGVSWFYRIVCFLFLTFIIHQSFGKAETMEMLFPINLKGYWFINCYIVLYLFSPYLNRVTSKMTEKEFAKFLFLMLILLSFLPIITAGKFLDNNGFNIITFTIMYYFGSFCKKYPLKDNKHFEGLTKKSWRYLLLFLFLFIPVIRVGLLELGTKMTNINSEILNYIGTDMKATFLFYSSPLVMIQTCAYCLFFESFNFKSKLINYMASTTLGIYLIHDNFNLRGWLYQVLNLGRYGANKKVFVMIILGAIFIYITSFLIESIRKLFVKIIHKMMKKNPKKVS